MKSLPKNIPTESNDLKTRIWSFQLNFIHLQRRNDTLVVSLPMKGKSPEFGIWLSKSHWLPLNSHLMDVTI